MTKAEKWARTVKSQIKEMHRKGFNQAWVAQATNMGFRAYTPIRNDNNRRSAHVNETNLVGVYTMDVPLKHLEEDIQAFIDINTHKRARFGMLA